MNQAPVSNAPSAPAPAPAPASAPAPAPAPASAARRRVMGVVLGTAGALALAAAGWWWMQGRWHAGTDDAYVNADLTQVAAQVGGTVKAVTFDAGQPVPAGEVMVQLDDADARIAVSEAEAQLAKAVRAARGLARSADAAGTAVAQRSAERAAASAAVDAAEVALVKARSDLAREEGLARQGFVSGQALESYRAAVAGAQAQRDQALQSLRAAGAVVGESALQARAAAAPVAGVSPAGQPDVVMAAGALRQALLNLDRTRVVAPREGVSGPRVVQPGEHVAAGAAVATVVPLGQAWVDANFKESDLERLRPGQAATLTADAYGDKVVYHGTVAGITPATGSALSLLPAQNATGNWIKVVQRVPVRITLDPQQLQQHPLQVGLSMNVDVDLHPQSADQGVPQAHPVASAVPAVSTPAEDAASRAAEARVASIIAANLLP